jgi:hypothetical protein
MKEYASSAFSSRPRPIPPKYQVSTELRSIQSGETYRQELFGLAALHP